MLTVDPTTLRRAAGMPIPTEVATTARQIVDDVRTGGDAALRSLRDRYDRPAESDAPLLLTSDVLENAKRSLPHEHIALLERTAERIQHFADLQRNSLSDLDTPLRGGRAGHDLAPVEAAGCYAPGGRYPLVSSVLMTAVTARSAGVSTVYVATPNPNPTMLAAAAIAGADAVIACGGAHAIGALAYGTETVPGVDAIVGPGNLWVTAAKQYVSGHVGIDMLAGPSELLVVADAGANPDWVAADLLAQAEHDPDARVILVTTSGELRKDVESAAERQLEQLSTRETASAAWAHAAAVVCDDEDACVAIANRLAPEHLHLHWAADRVHDLAKRMRNYGAIFIGERSAEVLGDYGAGPNHVLPTGGTSRFRGGLSVLTFLRMRTWLEIGHDPALATDAAMLARLEGLAGHEAAALLRGK